VIRPQAFVALTWSLLITPAVTLAQESLQKPEDLRLLDYKPVPMMKVLSEPIERAKFPAINVHTHPGRLNGQDQVDRLVSEMDDANVAVIVSLDGMSGDTLSKHSELLTNKHPGRFVVFAQIDYRGDGKADDTKSWAVNQPGFGEWMAAKLEDAVRRGARGLKIHKSHGLYYRDIEGKLITVDDARYDPIWSKCGELKIPVLIHTSDPAAFFIPLDPSNERYEELAQHPNWHFFGKDYPTQSELLEARNRVVERHPATNFIAAHMLNHGEDLQYVASCLDKYRNLYVETAERIAELGRQPYTARRFFLKYADRILFGTDEVPGVRSTGVAAYSAYFRFFETSDEYFRYMPTDPPPTGRWYIYGIHLPDEVLRKVYYENAIRLIPGLTLPKGFDAPSDAEVSPVMTATYIETDFSPDGNLEKAVWKDVPSVWIERNSVNAARRPSLRTRVQSLWSNSHLYLAFHCPYGTITVFEPGQTEERWQLWEKDVVEAFIGADFDDIDSYKEFEVAPNNDWLDLDIGRRSKKVDWAWNSGWQHATQNNASRKVWTCEMRIPLASIDGKGLVSPGTRWRINLYRCDDSESPRAYLAWNPPRCRSFHAPSSFGTLEFRR
jgi:predicted TIM-barrel fold metal-dependent hydrolase